MRIAFILNFFPNLSETFILNQITGLIDRGCEVDIYADQPAKTQVHPDVEYYRLIEQTHYLPIPNNYARRLSARSQLLFSALWKVTQTMHSLNVLRRVRKILPLKLLDETISHMGYAPYDIIHCHFGPNGLRGMMLRENGILCGKLITTFYGYDTSSYLNKVGHQIYSRLFREGDLFIAISDTMKRQLINFGCEEKKSRVHRLGINLARFTETARQPSHDGRLRIVTIGRFAPKKGIEYGIRAVAQLSRAKYPLVYTIVGDGDLCIPIKQLVQDLGIGHVVNLVGWKKQPEVIDILKHSDILLAPSVTSKDGDQEGTPVVIMEAMAMGLPVVSTLHSGIPEIVHNGVSGHLVPEYDVGALTQALIHLIENPQICTRMGLVGRAIIEKQYNIHKLNDCLLEIYRNLIT